MTEETIFAAALEKVSKAERAAFVAVACAGNEALRLRVQALLESHEETRFLKTSAVERAAIDFSGDPTAPATDPTDGADADPPLDFLEPSDSPGSLGRLGHYEVQEVIGRGGMGVVLRAFDQKLHRVVAIKVMAAQIAASAAARRRFSREAQAAAAVSHDHVLTIYGVDEIKGTPFLVMPYVAGLSLHDRIVRDGPLQLVEILRVGMQAAAGLAAAHAQGLIHRDIKPANILLENGVERVKITDFGLARAADDACETQSGVVAGTPSYMAPEQAKGEAVDPRADLFSLGSVLYTMCTGRAPFRASGTMATLKRVIEEQPSPIRQSNPEIPNWLVAIIEKLHSKDPADRYQSATEVAEVLGQCLAHVQRPSAVPLPAMVRHTTAPSGRLRQRWVAAALLVLAMSGLGLGEATGVSNLASTVIRILTPDGTLVVEANDPSVKVTIEGDGGLVITGAGAQEVRLSPGSYQVHATKGGKPVSLDRELVTITRGKRQVVRIRMVGDPVTPATVGERGSFVLLGGAGVPELEFDSLAEAVEHTSVGDTIEVRGNGPFDLDALDIGYSLTVRAGAGFRPILVADPRAEPSWGSLVISRGSLRLEGLEIRADSRVFRIVHGLGPLWLANCRLLFTTEGAVCIEVEDACVARNCELMSARGAPLAIRCNTDASSEVTNSIVVGHMNLDEFELMKAPSIRLSSNTWVSYFELIFHALHPMNLPTDQIRDYSGKRIELVLTGNLLEGPTGYFSLGLNHEFRPRFEAPEALAWIPRRLRFVSDQDIYSPVSSYMGNLISVDPDHHQNVAVPLSAGQDFAGWMRYWGQEDTGSSEGDVRFQGGQLADRSLRGVTNLTPEDFRLRPDSAGYRAGRDGKDLGADVDLVGPGPAYERWKKSPEYQDWLRETGQYKHN